MKRSDFSEEQIIGVLKEHGPVTLSCRPRCSFKPPFARKRPDFSNPVVTVP